MLKPSPTNVHIWSLSARRAWIEIKVRYPWTPLTSVALRKESVDRNNKAVKQLAKDNGSLSARRAWIEIRYVDLVPVNHKSRSPQGERG